MRQQDEQAEQQKAANRAKLIEIEKGLEAAEQGFAKQALGGAQEAVRLRTHRNALRVMLGGQPIPQTASLIQDLLATPAAVLERADEKLREMAAVLVEHQEKVAELRAVVDQQEKELVTAKEERQQALTARDRHSEARIEGEGIVTGLENILHELDDLEKPTPAKVKAILAKWKEAPAEDAPEVDVVAAGAVDLPTEGPS